MILRRSGDGWVDPIFSEVPLDPRDAFLAMVERFCIDEKGPRIYPTNRCHEICSKPKIFQLSGQYPYRFPFFYAGARTVIFTHAFSKKGGKTNTVPPAEREKAVALFNEYQAAEKSGRVEIDE